MPWTSGEPTLHYRRWGDGGRRVVLIHEMGGGLASWEPVAERLADEFRLLAYDQRGAGWSEKPPGPLALADQVDDLEAVLAANGWSGEASIAAAAAGSAIAVAYALRRPEAVSALALCVPSLSSTPAQRQAGEERAAIVRRDGMRGLADAALAAIYPEEIRDDRFADYRARLLAHDPESFALLGEAFAGVDLPLERLRVRCLLLAGELDRARPPQVVAGLAEQLAGARFEPVPGAAHVPAFQVPEEVARRLRSFLGSV